MREVKELMLFDNNNNNSELGQDDIIDINNIRPRINYGDVYRLGENYLMCGDARKLEDINKLLGDNKPNLILQDPPYGMKCQDKNGAIGDSDRITIPPKERGKFNYGRKHPISPRRYIQMSGDNSQNTAEENFNLIKKFSCVKIIWGAQYFSNFLPVSGAWIFWDKMTGNNDFSDGELAWISKGKRVRKYQHLWNGVCREGSPRLNLKRRIHPTQKPVELYIKILNDFSKRGDLILDCFGGSGTCLIACNETGRRCYIMELNNIYCEIIIKRWELLTNNKAVRLGCNNNKN